MCACVPVPVYLYVSHCTLSPRHANPSHSPSPLPLPLPPTPLSPPRPQASDESGWTALHLACDTGDVQSVTALLSNRAGVNLEARSRSGQTALCRALYWGSAPCTRLLLSRGADANAVENDGCSLLVRAVTKAGLGAGAESGRAAGEGLALELAQLLLEHGASALVCDAKGASPAQLAEARGFSQLAGVLRGESGEESSGQQQQQQQQQQGGDNMSLLALAALSMQ